MAESRVVEFFFSPGSRYCYLAASQVPSIEAECDCKVEWRPLNGADLRTLRGRDPFAGEPLSGQYEWSYRRRDAEMWAEYYGIRFREPATHEFDFQLLAHAAMAAKRLSAEAEYGWRLCSTVYGSDIWPIDEPVCVRIAEESGLRRGQFAKMLRDEETAALLQSTAEEAFRRGAFGVPTFFFGDAMYWGNDRIVLLKHALRLGREFGS